MSEAATPRRFVVRAPSGATDVVVGAGVLGRAESLVEEAVPRAKAALWVVDAGVASLAVHGRWAGEWRPDPARTLVVSGGEPSKTREVHARIEDAILDAGLTRDDVVVGLGGGAVLDVVGYAAATARRGVPWVAVPTSVVGQVDASIGGKTAINHARGKNLLGTFHAPVLAIVDVTALRTLPSRDRIAGLAEAYKAGVVGDPALVSLLDVKGGAGDERWWLDVVVRALAVKAALVAADERDRGARKALNYGHTIGHALETSLGPDAIRHGEAVSVGMGVAAEIARARGRVEHTWVDRQDDALARLGLPIRVPATADASRLLEIVGEDKKRRAGGALSFVLPRAAGGVDVLEDVVPAEVEAAIAARRERRSGRRA